MTSRAARRELPELAEELLIEIKRLPNIGPLEGERLKLYNELLVEIEILPLVKIGIAKVLSDLQYKIDFFGRYFWVYDEQQEPLEEMLELINEFLESPRLSL